MKMTKMKTRCSVPKWTFLAIICIMLISVRSGNAIKCFYCDSSVNPGCTNLKSNSSIKAEVCTLEKMKSLNTWLSELQKIDYLDSWSSSPGLQSVPMHCQKVVGKRQGENEIVTARFCQLDTRDTDACSILRAKVKDSGDEIHFCAICKNEQCNSANTINFTPLFQLIVILTILMRFIAL